MRIGILTGGGDAPGLNAWELTKESVQGILHRGGTILGSSGADPYHEGRTAKVRRTFADSSVTKSTSG
jgi:6-phosphofructokinase